MKITIIILLTLHGIVHLLGFSPWNLRHTQNIRHPTLSERIAWLLASVLFLATAAMIIFEVPWWWITAIAGLILSQVLIIMNWKAARAGTILNAAILVLAIIGFMIWSFGQRYHTLPDHHSVVRFQEHEDRPLANMLRW